MTDPAFILASQSAGRIAMLRGAGLAFESLAPNVDEAALKAALIAEGQSARNIADALAEANAIRVSARAPGLLVLGADQTLALADGTMLAKPESPDDACRQLAAMRGARHTLTSAVVAARDGAPVWRAVTQAHMTVRRLSDEYIAAYVDAQWDRIRWTVGCYEIEGAGAQLFDRVEGDQWTIIGLPLLPLLGWLRTTGVIAS
jgi:septum formation protein